ncbi:hypothetical protein J8Z24_11920 [Pseudoalteromonas sp. SCSIO 43201]|uniref:hypothetical protein n=1 Tax=Pseudoalteromonas sp. SCSIO 43201 TaxID=2822842 RepID=UPI002075E8A7|nr:hypothetical protein [Pseudoalteromonas sp. SCSIO 43201]USD27657.1 hypothetical protein J8Z24_11920 [Pseudoalteromonas sp. SCSIO 43201]
MSETAGTVIKLLAALTSPKACVKYLMVAISLYLSWLHLAPNLADLEITSEQKSLILLLIGLGSGSLVGHFLSEISAFYWNKHKEKRNKAKEEKQEAEDKIEKEKVKREKGEALLEQIKSMFQHFTSEQKKLLRELTLQDKTINTRDSENEALIKNNFINTVLQVQYQSYVVTINPAIKDFIKQHWNAELDMRIQEFNEIHGENSNFILDLMTEGNANTNIDPSIFENLQSSTGIINKGLDDEGVPGLWLWFDFYIREKLTELNGKEYLDEVFIEESRFAKSA